MQEFNEGMITLFSESFSKMAKFIFNFYDFDKDGAISREDVRVVLSYIPLNTNKYSQLKSKFEQEDFKDRVESQDEIHSILEKCFKNSETLDEDSFLSVVENTNSDMFLFILIFLLEKRPFSKSTLNEFTGSTKTKSSHLGVNKTPTTQSKMMIASPSLKSKFTPSVTISKSPSMSKRNTLGLGTNINLDSKNMLLKLSGKSDVHDQKNVLLKYAGKSGNHDNTDEGTDEGVSVNNVRGIPITRKQRHNLRDIEGDPQKKENKDYSDLPITPAVKYQVKKNEEE